MSTCIKCLRYEATERCKMCHNLICRECRILIPEGVFCSEECLNEFTNFQKKVERLDKKPVYRRKGVPGIIKLLLFLGVVWAVLYFVVGVKSWTEFKELINSLVKKYAG